MTQRCDDINKFWKGVHKAVVDSGVAEPMPIWYVNWTQKFAASFRGKPLQSCSAEDVCRFLDSLARQENIERWQVKQARDSLVFLH